MNNRPYVLKETTRKAVKKITYSVAILPWGATEAHNLHLPHGTDIIETELIAIEAARIAWEQGARVVVLPTVPYGVNTGQLDIKLDVNMYPSTQALVLHDIIDSLLRQGIKKLLIINGHGGNDFKQMIREFQVKFPSVFLCTLNWWQIVKDKEYFAEPGDHAGEMETSLMMHLVPQLVLPLSEAGKGAARKFSLQGLREGWVWAQRQWTKVTDDTGVGNPSQATVEKGKIFFEVITKKIAGFLAELAAVKGEVPYR